MKKRQIRKVREVERWIGEYKRLIMSKGSSKVEEVMNVFVNVVGCGCFAIRLTRVN